MLRPKATKTSLYKLASSFQDLPPMRSMTLCKADRRPSYWLEWYEDCQRCSAFFSACCGKGVLVITRRNDRGETNISYPLELEDLKARGMVEEFISAAERRQQASV